MVFLAMDDCNRGVASGTLKINNLGKGRLTYTVAASPSAALVYSQSSGLAPSTITFTMEPGRSGVVRQPGTNIWTGAGTQHGTPINLTLSSPDAINIPNTIRVYMNYRQSDQRGVIYPVPTTLNNNPAGTAGNTSGNEGLQDILLDEARGLVYITNSGFNRIEVFDTQKQHFVNPIPAGQMPHQMAMGSDGNTLYVGNTGGESISIIDLNLQRVVDSVVFPPVQRNSTAAPIYPRSLAMGILRAAVPDVERHAVEGGGQPGAAASGGSERDRSGDAHRMPELRHDRHAGQRLHSDAFGQRDGLRLRCDGGCIRDQPAADSGADSGLLRSAGRGTGRRVLPGERADCEPVADDHRRFGVTRGDGHHGRRRRSREAARRWFRSSIRATATWRRWLRWTPTASCG